MVGSTFCSTTSRVITTPATSSRLGTSYITLRSTSSMMALSPRAGAALHRLVGDCLQRLRLELQLDAVELEQSLILL